MFGRVSNHSKDKQQPAAKDENVRKESQLEQDLLNGQSIGNQATLGMPPLPPNAGNQAANDLLKDDDLSVLDSGQSGTDHYAGNMLSPQPVKSSRRRNKITDNNSRQESADHYTENMLPSQPVKSRKSRKSIITDDSEIDDENIISTSTRPRKTENNIPRESRLSAYGFGNDPDRLTLNSRLEKKGKNGSKRENVGRASTLEKGNEIKAELIRKIQKSSLDEDEKLAEMEKIKSWNFTPQKLEKVKEKPGARRKFLSFLSWAAGSLLALPSKSMMYMAQYITSMIGSKAKMQEKREHEQIPGWNGATFDKNANGEEVLADFRRVPTVWSYLIADRAADDDGKKPRDPVITVFSDQPTEGSSETLDGGTMGHTMIGIEYSRFSKVSNKYERYAIKYGFYPAGGTTENLSTLALLTQNAKVPGQLKDDRNHKYSISRRYPARQEQVNAIIKASETYADDGYGYYDRNCTTFVKEMVVDVAHLPAGDKIFKTSAVLNSHRSNFGIFSGNLVNAGSEAATDLKLLSLKNRNDQSYANYGNKRLTREEFDRYKKSISTKGKWSRSTYTPAATAERMRQADGENAGEVGSYKYLGDFEDDEGELSVSLPKLDGGIKKEGDAIVQFIQNNEAFGPQWLSSAPSEVVQTINSFPLYGAPLKALNDKVNDYCERTKQDRTMMVETAALKPSELQEARKQLSENISTVGTVLHKYLQNDARLQKPFMNFISVLNIGVNYIDRLYQNVIRGNANISDDLGNIRESIGSIAYQVNVDRQKMEFTPNHYESYLQIYKTPEKAVNAYKRLKELKQKKANNEKMNKAEKKEFSKLLRLEDLAMDFNTSHQYMLEKDEYNQQDIDYAFDLNVKEQKGASSSMFMDYSAMSDTYISLILEKIFKGMSSRMSSDAGKGGLSEDPKEQTPEAVAAWLDKDMSECVKKDPKKMEMIVRGMKRSMKPENGQEPKKDDIKEKISEMFKNEWIGKIFSHQPNDQIKGVTRPLASVAVGMIVMSGEFAFGKLIENLINKVLKEKDRKQAPA